MRNSVVVAIFAPIELFTDAKMPARKALDDLNSTVKATNRPPSIWIVVKPEKRDRFTARVQGEQAPLCVSRQPFLDSARKLLVRGHNPRTMLVMVLPGGPMKAEWKIALRFP